MSSPFKIYEDPHTRPDSAFYSGPNSTTASHPSSPLSPPAANFTADDPLPTTEPSDDLPSIFSDLDPHSRRTTLHSTLTTYTTGTGAGTCISSMPPSEPTPTYKLTLSSSSSPSKSTPRKQRPPFRNPSSVRAMQMSSPPFEVGGYGSSLVRSGTRRRRVGSRDVGGGSRAGTPGGKERWERFEREGTGTGSVIRHKLREEAECNEDSFREGEEEGEEVVARMERGERETGMERQAHPLVLLHITLLPTLPPYPAQVMEQVLPRHIMENYELLASKTSETTLLSRGVLIRHPREEYELLEERLLESLELATPRLLNCGHFGSAFGHDREEERTSFGERNTDETSRDNLSDNDNVEEEEICPDCGGHYKDPSRFGSGHNSRRWDIKIYAANGLMRAGAWSAAWSEMERVDVEIGVWIPQGLRRELDEAAAAYAASEEARSLREVEEEEEVRQRAALLLIDEGEMRRRGEQTDAPDGQIGFAINGAAGRGPLAMHEAFLDHHVLSAPSRPHADGNGAQRLPDAKAGVVEEGIANKVRTSQSMPRSPKGAVPLDVLVRNYLYLLARDRRNIALLVLSVVVLQLSLTCLLPARVERHPITARGISIDVSPALTSSLPPGLSSVLQGDSPMTALGGEESVTGSAATISNSAQPVSTFTSTAVVISTETVWQTSVVTSTVETSIPTPSSAVDGGQQEEQAVIEEVEKVDSETAIHQLPIEESPSSELQAIDPLPTVSTTPTSITSAADIEETTIATLEVPTDEQLPPTVDTAAQQDSMAPALPTNFP